MIKFLCKDIWTLVFRKQIDNLKTNHRVLWLVGSYKKNLGLTGLDQGVYVLTDHSFRPFARMSMASPSETLARVQPVCKVNHDRYTPQLMVLGSFSGSPVVSLGALWLAWVSRRQCRPKPRSCLVQPFRSKPSRQRASGMERVEYVQAGVSSAISQMRSCLQTTSILQTDTKPKSLKRASYARCSLEALSI